MVQIIDKSEFTSLDVLDIQAVDSHILKSNIPKINFKKIKFKRFQGMISLENTVELISPLDIARKKNSDNFQGESYEDVMPLRKLSSGESTAEETFIEETSALETTPLVSDLEESKVEVEEQNFNIDIPVTSKLNEEIASIPLVSWPPKSTKAKKNKKKKKKTKSKPYFISNDKVIQIHQDDTNIQKDVESNEQNATTSQAFPWGASQDGYENLEGIFSGGLESQLVDAEDVHIDGFEVSKEKLEAQEEEIDSIFAKKAPPPKNIEENNYEDTVESKPPEPTNQPLVIRAIMPNIPKLDPPN